MTDLKQVILIRADLKLPKGKACAQASHAAVECTIKTAKASKAKLKKWHEEGMKKVVLKVKDKEELFRHIQSAKDNGLVTCVITDAGRTVVEPGTVTCAAIGPDDEDKIDSVTSDLSMY